MTIVGFSQRIDFLKDRSELRESLDSALVKIFSDLSYTCIPISSFNSDLSLAEICLSCDYFVLSGGNDIGEYPTRDKLEYNVLNHSIFYKKPVLGICRGMQTMLAHQEFVLHPVSGHANSRHNIFFHNEMDLSINVNSFHNYGIASRLINRSFKVIASSEDDITEQIKHLHYPWSGIMWHPEREASLTDYDRNLIQNLFP